jgi:mono/diheme cytochrome c family protein
MFKIESCRENGAMGHSRTIVNAFVLAILLVSAGPGLTQTLTPLQRRGEEIAKGMCSGCHAVGRTGDSPLPAAPRFRMLDNRTDLSKLARRLREGLLTGHEAMPMFRFNRQDADAMVAYMRAIQGP